MVDNAISVTQLSNYIKSIFLAEEMLFDISVYGEISGLTFFRNIAYFNLKDENAILPCVCFDVTNFAYCLVEGKKVILKGTPNYYVKGGKLNFNVVSVKPFGDGELYQSYLNLKEKLKQDGLFDEKHKKVLPDNIKRIGVATSETGAVIHDIINVVSRRDPNIDIVLAPCKVQGDKADKEICNAVRLLECVNVDLIIIARGGGSFEDLNCFNSEELAYTIFNSQKFILSAVGHETDFTICDFVADMRAPTPSAAAELVSKNILEKKEKLAQLIKKISFNFSKIKVLKEELKKLKIDMESNFNTLMKSKTDNIKKIASKFVEKIINFEHEYQYQFGIYETNIKNRNPKKLLDLGYVKVEKENKLITSIQDIDLKEDINVIFSDGEIVATVKDIKGDKV